MAKEKDEGKNSSLTATFLSKVTQIPVRRLQLLEFAGFLTHEDNTAIYVADTQGTRVIPLESVAFLEDWEHGKACAPENMHSVGRPVRVGIKDGATIQEIRPWQVHQTSQATLYSRNVRMKCSR